MEILEKIVIPEVYLPILYVCIAILINTVIKNIITKGINKKLKTLPEGTTAYKKLLTVKSLSRNIIK